MVSSNATTCLGYFPASPVSDQHMWVWAILKILENSGTDGSEAIASDDVVAQVAGILGDSEHPVVEKMSQLMHEVRDKLTR